MLRLHLGQLISSPCLEKTFVLQTEDRHLKVNLFGLPLLTSSADRENHFPPCSALENYRIETVYADCFILWYHPTGQAESLHFSSREGFSSLGLP